MGPNVRRLKILMSAYACEPDKGSEPGVGWSVAQEMAKYHDVWVITRANNRPTIEAAISHGLAQNLHFAFYDLPRRTRSWKRGGGGVQLYYYLWQVGTYFVARNLHRQINFDLAHHVTFVKYWAPSFVSLLPIPFIWGPVGGGESAPKPFCCNFSSAGRRYEIKRRVAQWLGERDPFVRLTARRSVLALATTGDTGRRLEAIGAKTVWPFSQVGFSSEEIERLGRRKAAVSTTFRLISIGNLVHWKGFELGLRAFAHANHADAEYWIIGDGPERSRLESLAKILGVAQSVKFFAEVPRDEALGKLAQCHVLVHPSLHDSGGFVCLEAMALGKPVICLDLGGPAVQVTGDTGFKVPACSPRQAVSDMALAMKRLANDQQLCASMGAAAQRRVVEHFSWSHKGKTLAMVYQAAAAGEDGRASVAGGPDFS